VRILEDPSKWFNVQQNKADHSIDYLMIYPYAYLTTITQNINNLIDTQFFLSLILITWAAPNTHKKTNQNQKEKTLMRKLWKESITGKHWSWLIASCELIMIINTWVLEAWQEQRKADLIIRSSCGSLESIILPLAGDRRNPVIHVVWVETPSLNVIMS
jgi:hypothetical protein